MANKRTRAGVPATETGAIPGDGGGNRSFTKMPSGAMYTDAIKKGSHARGGGPAPRPQNSKSQLMGASAHTAPTQASLARVKAGGQGDSGLRMPPQFPKANLQHTTVGHKALPNTGAASTQKPKTRAALAFYGE